MKTIPKPDVQFSATMSWDNMSPLCFNGTFTITYNSIWQKNALCKVYEIVSKSETVFRDLNLVGTKRVDRSDILSTEFYKTNINNSLTFKCSYFTMKDIPYELCRRPLQRLWRTRQTCFETNSIYFKTYLVWNVLAFLLERVNQFWILHETKNIR